MTKQLAGLLAAVLGAAACAAPQPPGTGAPLPERIVLQYDFAGDWAATAGDACEKRVDISDATFLGIARTADGAYHIARFFMLEQGQQAEAAVGVPDADGVLTLTLETRGVVDGRTADITYDLVLKPLDPQRIRLAGFTMTMRDQAGQTVEVNLLADPTADRKVPVLSIAGKHGLCLERL